MSSNPTRGTSARDLVHEAGTVRLERSPVEGLFSLFFLVQGLGDSTGALGATRLNSYKKRVSKQKCSASPLHQSWFVSVPAGLYPKVTTRSRLSNGSRETLPNSRVNLLA